MLRGTAERGARLDGSLPAHGPAGGLSGACAQCRLQAFELLSLVALVLAGHDKSGLSRPREYRLRI